MGKKLLSLLLAGCMVVSFAVVPAAATDVTSDGEGVLPITENEPSDDVVWFGEQPGDNSESDNKKIADTVVWGSDYDTTERFTISNEEQLLAFAQMVNSGKDFENKIVTLSQSIMLTGENWTPIGSADVFDDDYDEDAAPSFAGTFDGGDYSISNLTLSYGIEDSDPVYDYGGLFGHVTGTIQNVNLVSANITVASGQFGGIAGFLDETGKIENCTVSGAISGAQWNGDLLGASIGGIVGKSKGTITSCSNDSDISNSVEYVGGIVGQLEVGTVDGCVNTGSISGKRYIGGIAGAVKVGTTNTAVISDCSNKGNICAEEATSENQGFGGIVGMTTGDVSISDCSNSGAISARAKDWVGGIVGQLYSGGTVEDCSNDASVEGATKVGGIIGYALANSGDGYEIKGCENSGAITGTSKVGGIAGVTSADRNKDTILSVSGCTNAGTVSGSESVGGIVGNHNSGEGVGNDEAAATVSGCINTGTVPGSGGAIVGTNNTGTTGDSTNMVGKVENNFWPAELGENAVGSGAGSSGSESSEAVKNNSSYQSDGTLTTPVQDSSGSEIGNLGDAIDKVIGGGNESSVPEVLKVTVTYNNGGHGTAPEGATVTKGSKVTLESMPNDGYYTFTGWKSNGTDYKAGLTITVMEDMTFTAQWRDDTPSTPVIPSDPSDNSDPTYSISLPSKVTGGEVSLQKRYAEKGETVTITVTPDEGYELDELIVTDSKGNELELTDKGNGKFTFKMPAGRVEIEVSFHEIVIEPVNPFVDVSTSDYYYDAVLWAVENGVTNGTSATTFGPNMAVSRAQMVTFLWRAHGSPKATGTNPFTDVSTSDYYYDAVLWAVANGVTNGTSDTTFSPDTAVTRSQAVTFQWRAAGSPVVSGSSFGDVATDAYYVNAVTWAVANGITNGTGGNTFSPDVVVSRAQAVTFLYREQE